MSNPTKPKKQNADLLDDNPEWTDAMFAKAKRGPASAKRTVGRPKAAKTKIQKTLRLSPEVIDYFQSTGKGWQTRIDEVLAEYARAHK